MTDFHGGVGQPLKSLLSHRPCQTIRATVRVDAADLFEGLLVNHCHKVVRTAGYIGPRTIRLHEDASGAAPKAHIPLGMCLLLMVRHLERHKTRLFYYLKLQDQIG
jgi:hypothetical protein